MTKHADGNHDEHDGSARRQNTKAEWPAAPQATSVASAQLLPSNSASRYSARNAWMTSMREARAAGMSDATTAAATRIAAAPRIGSAPGIRTPWI
jgi:hypothetical protein